MRSTRSIRFCFLLLALALLGACRSAPPNPEGQWRGLMKNPSGEQIVFTLEVKREGARWGGAFLNGDERTPASDGSFDGKTLRLRFDFYDGALTAEIDGGRMRGRFDRQWQKKTLTRELTAVREAATTAAATTSAAQNSPINGEWILTVGDAPNQKLWRAAFQSVGGAQGTDVRGTLIPVSGDWGEMRGTFANGELKLYRFDVINARVFRARLTPQGTLEGALDFGLFDPLRKVTAERLTDANRALVAALPDPNNYTRMGNPAEPFRFSFPDLNGQTISSTDERFKNKVVIASITGSWCPNCHEESPFLQQMYERYNRQGLEVVALALNTRATARATPSNCASFKSGTG